MMDPPGTPPSAAVAETSMTSNQESDSKLSDTSKEMIVFTLENTLSTPQAPKPFVVAKSISNVINTPPAPKPFLLAQSISNVNNQPSSSQAFQANANAHPVTTQPSFKTFLNLPSPMSLKICPSDQPQSLFLQALSKLNENSAIWTTLSQMRSNISVNRPNLVNPLNKNISGPDNITPCPSAPSANAPPSYSFVLRQMSHQRRPRLMGTFIPSPSFVVHTPPPNYTTAFDIYVDNPIPPPPRTTRVFGFGYASMPAICPECGYSGMTMVTSKVTLCTHLCAMTLCLFCCWVCAPLPYIMMSCKDVYHYCRNCQTMLGMYCPTDPDCTYP